MELKYLTSTSKDLTYRNCGRPLGVPIADGSDVFLFFQIVKTDCCAQTVPYSLGAGAFLEVERGRNVKLATRLRLVHVRVHGTTASAPHTLNTRALFLILLFPSSI